VEFLLGSIIMSNGGAGSAKDAWGKSYFEREVEFEGAFKGLKPITFDNQKKQHEQEWVLDFEVPKTSPPAITYIYPQKAASAKWQAIKAGRAVRFKARIRMIVVTDIRGPFLIVTLDEAEPAE
jgi:hypothetical protein